MWTDKTITKFWQQCESDYSGDIKAFEIIRLSKKYIKGKVLDVGAGSGALIKLLPNAVGVDIAPKNPRIVQGNINKLPFADGLFGTTFCTDILEHLENETLNKGLAEVHRVLANQGVLIAVIPYKEDMNQSMVSCPNCHAKFHRWGHLRIFDEMTIKEYLESHGFYMINIKILPLSLMAEHWLIRYFWKLFVAVGFVKANDIFLVAQKS